MKAQRASRHEMDVYRASLKPHTFGQPNHGFATAEELLDHVVTDHGIPANKARYAEEMRHTDAHRFALDMDDPEVRTVTER